MAKKKTPPVLDELGPMMDLVKHESDRGVALILSALVDDALEQMLKTRMIDEAKVTDDLFGVERPIGTFSSRINIAYALGIIGKARHQDLHTIRDIRNLFAHDRGAISFRTQSVRDRCNNLRHCSEMRGPRNQFALAGFVLAGYFITLSREPERPTWSAEKEEQVFDRFTDNLIAAFD